MHRMVQCHHRTETTRGRRRRRELFEDRSGSVSWEVAARLEAAHEFQQSRVGGSNDRISGWRELTLISRKTALPPLRCIPWFAALGQSGFVRVKGLTMRLDQTKCSLFEHCLVGVDPGVQVITITRLVPAIHSRTVTRCNLR